MKKYTLILLFLMISILLFIAACDTASYDAPIGEPFDFAGLEITVSENIGFTRLDNPLFTNHGAYVFYIPVTVTNRSNSSRSLNHWHVSVFSADETNLDNAALTRGFEEHNFFMMGDVQPGVTQSGNVYVLYSQDRDYILEFYYFDHEAAEAGGGVDDIINRSHIPLEIEFDFDALPEFVWVLETHLPMILTSDEMRRFEEDNAVSPERTRYLAFGAFITTYNLESPSILALRNSRRHAPGLLRRTWGIEDREGALEQLRRLATATGQSPIADELYRNLVQNNQLEPLDPALMFIFTGFDFTDFENLYDNSISRAEQMEGYVDEDFIDIIVEYLETLDSNIICETDLENVFRLLVYIQFAERANRGLNAFLGARDLLMDYFDFTEEELLDLPTLAAWDFGRVAFVARYSVAAGFIEEDEAWEYIKIAADHASELYASWREFTAAYILGRALGFGSPSDDYLYVLNFLLNHPEGPFRTIEFSP